MEVVEMTREEVLGADVETLKGMLKTYEGIELAGKELGQNLHRMSRMSGDVSLSMMQTAVDLDASGKKRKRDAVREFGGERNIGIARKRVLESLTPQEKEQLLVRFDEAVKRTSKAEESYRDLDNASNHIGKDSKLRDIEDAIKPLQWEERSAKEALSWSDDAIEKVRVEVAEYKDKNLEKFIITSDSNRLDITGALERGEIEIEGIGDICRDNPDCKIEDYEPILRKGIEIKIEDINPLNTLGNDLVSKYSESKETQTRQKPNIEKEKTESKKAVEQKVAKQKAATVHR